MSNSATLPTKRSAIPHTSSNARLLLRKNAVTSMVSYVMKSVGMNPVRSAGMNHDRTATRFPRRIAIAFQGKTATLSTERSATLNISRQPTMLLSRSATLYRTRRLQRYQESIVLRSLSTDATRCPRRKLNTDPSRNVRLSLRDNARRFPDKIVTTTKFYNLLINPDLSFFGRL